MSRPPPPFAGSYDYVPKHTCPIMSGTGFRMEHDKGAMEG